MNTKELKVNQIIKSGFNGSIRRITRISGNKIYWISKDAKGQCTKETLRKWSISGNV